MKHLRLLALGAFVGMALLLWLKSRDQDVDQAELRSTQAWLSSAGYRAAAKRHQLKGEVRTFERWHTTWDTVIHVDTLEAMDTVRIPVRILVVADSTIRSCSIALTTCQQLAALERERADSAERLAQLWRRQARGPLLRPYAELLFAGRTPRLAAVLEAGPQRLSAVARLEVDSLPRISAGVRYRF